MLGVKLGQIVCFSAGELAVHDVYIILIPAYPYPAIEHQGTSSSTFQSNNIAIKRHGKNIADMQAANNNRSVPSRTLDEENVIDICAWTYYENTEKYYSKERVIM